MPAIGFIDTVPIGEHHHQNSPVDDFISASNFAKKRSRTAIDDPYPSDMRFDAAATARPHKRARVSLQDAGDSFEQADVAAPVQQQLFNTNKDDHRTELNLPSELPAINLPPTDNGIDTSTNSNIDADPSAINTYKYPPTKPGQDDARITAPYVTTWGTVNNAFERHMEAQLTTTKSASKALAAEALHAVERAQDLFDPRDVYRAAQEQQRLDLQQARAKRDKAHRAAIKAKADLDEIVLTPEKKAEIYFERFERKPSEPEYKPHFWDTVVRKLSVRIPKKEEEYGKACQAWESADAAVQASKRCLRAIEALHTQADQELSEALRAAESLGERALRARHEASLFATRVQEAKDAARAEAAAETSERHKVAALVLMFAEGRTNCSSQQVEELVDELNEKRLARKRRRGFDGASSCNGASSKRTRAF